jgi:O-antigen ligase
MYPRRYGDPIRWTRSRRAKYLVVLMLLGAALFLSGTAAYWSWLALAGYLVTVAAWWGITRPRLTTRRLNWPRRWHH